MSNQYTAATHNIYSLIAKIVLNHIVKQPIVDNEGRANSNEYRDKAPCCLRFCADLL
jgi:hypothetical protein